MNLHGLSYDRAVLYGLPHIGARYARERKFKSNGARKYERLQEWCAVCGRPAANCHHVVPLSYGEVFERETPQGSMPLRSPLFAVCGSGTSGCHGRLHAAMLKARWSWDLPEYEDEWADGELLDRLGPHHPALYCYGQWEITDTKTGLVIARHRERY